MADRRKRKPPAAPPKPAMVPVHPVLLDTVRATIPATWDWTDAQLTAACLALAIRRPRIGLVHSD